MVGLCFFSCLSYFLIVCIISYLNVVTCIFYPQKGSNGLLFWVMRRNFRIPLEEELRRMVTPENVSVNPAKPVFVSFNENLIIERLYGHLMKMETFLNILVRLGAF